VFSKTLTLTSNPVDDHRLCGTFSYTASMFDFWKWNTNSFRMCRFKS